MMSMENLNLDELAREFVSIHENCKEKIYGNACKLFEDIGILIGFEMFNALFACIF